MFMSIPATPTEFFGTVWIGSEKFQRREDEGEGESYMLKWC